MPNPIEIEASVGEVIQLDFFSNFQYQSFTLGQDGLVVDETIVPSAPLIITFDLNNELAYSNIDESNNFNFSITLVCSNESFLSNCIKTAPSQILSQKQSGENTYTTANTTIAVDSSNSDTTAIKYLATYQPVIDTGVTNFQLNIIITDNNIKNYYNSESRYMPQFQITLSGGN